VINCERLLNFLPRNAPLRADMLEQMGTAHAMLQNFPQSYAAYTEALSLNLHSTELWYNRGMTSRFTSRFGKSLRDYERVKELNTRPELAKKLEEELRVARISSSPFSRAMHFSRGTRRKAPSSAYK